MEDAPGFVKDLDTGATVGEHRGLHHHTEGQRFVGLHSQAFVRHYVVSKDTDTNVLTVVSGREGGGVGAARYMARFGITRYWIVT